MPAYPIARYGLVQLGTDGGLGLAAHRLWFYAKLAQQRNRLHLPVLGAAVRWLYWAALIALALVLLRFLFRGVGLRMGVSFAGDRDDILCDLLYLADVFVGVVLADARHCSRSRDDAQPAAGAGTLSRTARRVRAQSLGRRSPRFAQRVVATQ